MKNYEVTPEFKTQVTTILSTKKFSTVFPFMNLVNRDGFTYTEQELNQVVQFLGEFPYNEVAEFFTKLSSVINELPADSESTDTKATLTEETVAEATPEVENA